MIKHSGDVVPLDPSKRLLKTLPRKKPTPSPPVEPTADSAFPSRERGEMSNDALYFAYDMMVGDITEMIPDAQQLGEHAMADALTQARQALLQLFRK